MEVLGMNSKLLKKLFDKEKDEVEIKLCSFPLQTEEELRALDESLNEENILSYIAAVKRKVHRGGIKVNLNKVLSTNIITDYNLDGTQGKRAFSMWKNINKVFESSEGEDVDYRTEMRKAFKNSKNRHFKNACIARKRSARNE